MERSMIYEEFLALNENAEVFNPKERLRDFVHDIVMALGDDEEISINELSNRLKKHNIDIPEKLLSKILEKWDRKDFTIFKKDDDTWLYYLSYMKKVKRSRKLKKSLGKHKDKLYNDYSRKDDTNIESSENVKYKI